MWHKQHADTLSNIWLRQKCGLLGGGENPKNTMDGEKNKWGGPTHENHKLIREITREHWLHTVQ